jgi:hypothetical protein
MDGRVTAIDFALVALMPVAAIASQWLKRWWYVVGLLFSASSISWLLLLQLGRMENVVAIEAFNRIPNPTDAQVQVFQTDGATNAAVFLLGLPAFLIYGGVCLLLIWVSRWLWKGLVHV